MVNVLKENLLRVAQQSKNASLMQIKIQHPYQYSKWDSIHEPYNVVENVLKDDEAVYKALTPSLDFNIAQGNMTYIAEVIVHPGDCGPALIEVNPYRFFTLYRSTSQTPWINGLLLSNTSAILSIKFINCLCLGNIYASI